MTSHIFSSIGGWVGQLQSFSLTAPPKALPPHFGGVAKLGNIGCTKILNVEMRRPIT